MFLQNRSTTKRDNLQALSLIENNKFGSDRFYEIMKRDYNRLRILADKGNGNALFALGVLGCLNNKKHLLLTFFEVLQQPLCEAWWSMDAKNKLHLTFGAFPDARFS